MSTRRVREFLDGSHLKYAMISHSAAYTAQEIAESTHIPGRELAKAVVVDLDGKLALAVVPASSHVDLFKLASCAGASFARVADENDFIDRFEGCQIGAAPPIGLIFGMDTYVDHALAREEWIAFNAGTHTDLIAMKFADYRRAARPKVVSIATEHLVPA